MKLISYVGLDGPVLTIERADDLYTALDWIHTQMCDLAEKGDNKAEKCADFIDSLLIQVEAAGFGNYEDIDNIEY